MQERINRLEALVTKLATQARESELNNTHSNIYHQPAEVLTPDSSHDQAHAVEAEERQPGIMMIEGNKSIYRGGSHWCDVMEEVRFQIYT
jgi:hypothetical protein